MKDFFFWHWNNNIQFPSPFPPVFFIWPYEDKGKMPKKGRNFLDFSVTCIQSKEKKKMKSDRVTCYSKLVFLYEVEFQAWKPHVLWKEKKMAWIFLQLIRSRTFLLSLLFLTFKSLIYYFSLYFSSLLSWNLVYVCPVKKKVHDSITSYYLERVPKWKKKMKVCSRYGECIFTLYNIISRTV